MNWFMNFKISTRVFVGYGLIILLLVMISSVGMYSLIKANVVFREYRSLARQTNAAGDSLDVGLSQNAFGCRVHHLNSNGNA